MKRAAALFCCLLFLFGSALAEGEFSFTVRNGSREDKRICITVDDCYHIENVQGVLDVCKENGVPVTFFVIGKVLRREDRETWQAVLDAGCEIGNHTWSHLMLPGRPHSTIVKQLTNTQSRLDEVLGYHYPMQVMRPPYGSLAVTPGRLSDNDVVDAVRAAGYQHAIKWDVSQTDPALAIEDVQNGSILLYHTNHKDIECLKVLIPQLLEQGYQPVTVSELLGLPPVETSPLTSDTAAQ